MRKFYKIQHNKVSQLKIPWYKSDKFIAEVPIFSKSDAINAGEIVSMLRQMFNGKYLIENSSKAMLMNEETDSNF